MSKLRNSNNDLYRYKLIRYEDDDATANLKIGPNHFLEVTVPMAATMFCVILFVLMCARWEASILVLQMINRRCFHNHGEGPCGPSFLALVDRVDICVDSNILIILFRSDSIICQICSAKERKSWVEEEE